MRQLHPEAKVLGIVNGERDIPIPPFLGPEGARCVLDPDRLRAELSGVIASFRRPGVESDFVAGPSTPGEIRDWLNDFSRRLRNEPGPTLKRTTSEL